MKKRSTRATSAPIKKLSLINAADYANIGFGQSMIRRYSAFYEIYVASTPFDGAQGKPLSAGAHVEGLAPSAVEGWSWRALIMDRGNSALLEEEKGLEGSEEAARRSSQEWVAEHMRAYKLEYDEELAADMQHALDVLRPMQKALSPDP